MTTGISSLKCNLRWLVFILICFTLVPTLLSQTATTGALLGTVKDSSGAVVPGATVTVTNLGTNQARTAATIADGTYRFGFLPPGTYKVKIEATGFSAAEVPSVTITVTETAVVDRALAVGGQQQVVEVSGEATAVQTASSTVGAVINGKTLTDLPLSGRNYTTLLGLAAGANAGVYNAAGLGRGSQDIQVNGSSTFNNNYQQDGGSINDISGRGNTADSGANPGIGVVNPDAIQEFKIQTSMFDAGYGRNSGANVNVVTKSGTNQYHGTAFEFFRNTALNANDFFRKQAVPDNSKQRLDQHQFGGTFGGPVKKDKLFFFTSFQETRQKNGISPAGNSNPTLVGIPQGDRSTPAFKAALGSAFCPGGSANVGGTNATSNGGTQVKCDGSNINPVAINLLNLKLADGSYFIPGSTTGVNQNTIISIPALYKERQILANTDYLMNNSNTLSFRWFKSRPTTDAPMGCTATGGAISQCLPGGAGRFSFPIQYGVLKHTSILNTRMVNEARFSMQRVVVEPQNLIPFTSTQVGIAPIVPTFNYLGNIQITGLMRFGAQLNLGSAKAVTNWQAADQISYSHGKHTTRAGFEVEKNYFNWTFDGAANVNETFQTFQDFLLGLPGCSPTLTAPQCAASAAAGLTNGTSTSNVANTGTAASITPPGGTVHHYRTHALSAFVQDDYKILSRLTLNLGLRWEYISQISDSGGLLTNVWPQLLATVPVPGADAAHGTLAGIVVPSNFDFSLFPAPPVGGVFQNSKNIPTLSDPSKALFAPRVGLAWKPLSSDRLVLRAGGGIFYDRLGQGNYNRPTIQGQPYALRVERSGVANVNSTMAQPYDPTLKLGWTPRWATINTTTNTGTSSNLTFLTLDPSYRVPRVYQWNLNLQYELMPRMVLEVGYVGSRGLFLAPETSVTETQLNGAKLASPANPVNGLTTNTVANAIVRVPYLGVAPAGLQSELSLGNSKYNSLQVTLRRKMSRGLTMEAAYTWTKALNTAIYNNYNDPLTFKYGANTTIRPQRFTISYAYELPFGHHDGFLGGIANGWSISGVTVIQNGTPLTPIDSRGGTIYGFGAGSQVTSTAQYASGMGNADVGTSGSDNDRLGGANGGGGWFNKAAFGLTPAIGNGRGFGNGGLGSILGPGQFNFDTSLQKTTRVGGIHEDATLVFRAEAFNMLNHSQFSNPTGNQLDVSTPQFGQITSTSVNPRLIQLALKYVF